MKTLILITAFIVGNFPSFSQTNFDRGFNKGYEKGYCLNGGVGCLAPLPPISPLPKIGENFNSYQDGYNRGFEMGLSEGPRSSNERLRYKTSSAEPIEYIKRQNLNDIISLAKVLKEAKRKSVELQEAGDYQASINIAEAGLKIIPKDDEFLMICASGYLNLENYSMGSAYLKKVAKFSHDLNSIKTSKEIIKEIETGEYQKKREEEKQETVQKQSEPNHGNLGSEINKSLNSRDYKKALELTNALVTQENSWESYALRGFIQFELKNYSDCIADYTKSIKISPTSDSYLVRALAKAKLEDYYGALNDYDKIIESGVPPENNDMATMYNDKAYTLVKLKKFAEALPFVNKAIELSTKKWYIWDTRGEINYQLGNYKKCIEDMTKAISINPDQNSYYFRGLSKIKLSDKTNGCQDLSKSGELGNSNAYTEIKKYCQ